MERFSKDMIKLIVKLEAALHALSENRLPSKYRRIFLGSGLDFEEFKAYTPGDDAAFIDWKATVRAQQTMMKIYKEERDLDIFFLLDTSNSMIFGSGQKLKLQTAMEFVACMAYMVILTNDSASLAMFSDKIKAFIPPGSTLDQYYIILRTLVNKKNYMGGRDINSAVRFIMNISKRRGVLFIVTDFLGLKPGWKNILKLASAKFEIIGIMVQDPRDMFLPTDVGQLVLGDPFSNKRVMIDPKKVRKSYEEIAREKEQDVRKFFSQINADLMCINTTESFIKPLIQYFKKREQLLWR